MNVSVGHESEAGRAEGEATRCDLNRLRWHCRRGMLELDMVLARFLEERYARLTSQQRQEFESLLDLEDQELWQRISGVTAAVSGIEHMLHDCLASQGRPGQA
jgi:antitoxin CptB